MKPWVVNVLIYGGLFAFALVAGAWMHLLAGLLMGFLAGLWGGMNITVWAMTRRENENAPWNWRVIVGPDTYFKWLERQA